MFNVVSIVDDAHLECQEEFVYNVIKSRKEIDNMKKTESIGVRVDEETKRILEEYAKINERTISWVANKAIKKFIREVVEKEKTA